MIFVTVGTHEQPFNRLVRFMDDWKKEESSSEEVIIQTGFSTYKPNHCKWQDFFPYGEIKKLIERADIIITHGGPSSFIPPLQIGKIPVVVPRQKRFGEHINDHQMNFCRAVAERNRNIIIVENIKKLKDIIYDYNHIISCMPIGIKNNNKRFNEEFEKIVDQLMRK